jgi:hypothetical protein
MIKNITFYEYINNKYIKLNNKLKHNIKIYQKGGSQDKKKSTLIDTQLNIIYLKTLVDFLLKKKSSVDTLNYQEIYEKLNSSLSGFGSIVKEINLKLGEEDPSKYNEAQLLKVMNLITVMDGFHSDFKENYLSITIPKSMKVLTPPINLPEIDKIHGQVVDQLNQNIKDVDNIINQKISDIDKILPINSNIEDITKQMVEKTTNINGYIDKLKKLINEIENYSNVQFEKIDFNSLDKLFQKSDDEFIKKHPTELIEIDQISGLSYQPDISNPIKDKDPELFNFTFNKEKDAAKLQELLVIPNFKQIQSGGSGLLINNNQKLENIINDIYKKWREKYNYYLLILKCKSGIDKFVIYYKSIYVNYIEIDKKNKEILEYIIQYQKICPIDINDYRLKDDKCRTNIKQVYDIIIDLNSLEEQKKYLEVIKLLEQYKYLLNSINIPNIEDMDLYKICSYKINTLILENQKIEKITTSIIELISNSKLESIITNIIKTLDENNICNDYKKKLIENLEQFKKSINDYKLVKLNYDNEYKLVNNFEDLIKFINKYIDYFNTVYIYFNNYKITIDNKDICKKEINKIKNKYDNFIEGCKNLCSLYKKNLPEIMNHCPKISNFDLYNCILLIKNVSIYFLKKINTDLGIQMYGAKKAMYKLLEFLIKSEDLNKLNNYYSPIYNRFIYQPEFNKLENIYLSVLIKQLDNIVDQQKKDNESYEFINKLLDSNLTLHTIQSGGADNFSGKKIIIDNFISNASSFYDSITKYKSNYSKFKVLAMDFNLKYIQLYNHLSYISSYINIVLLKKTYNVYSNISRGTLDYYRYYINTIFEKCQKDKNKNPVMEYFFKFHFVTLSILKNFTDNLYNKWGGNGKNESDKNNIKLLLIDNNIENLDIKKALFLFNIFKDIIDQYVYNLASPIGAYLRINDWDLSTDDNIVFKKDKDDDHKLSYSNLEKCKSDNRIIIENTPLLDLQSINQNITKSSQLKFNQIYDTIGFNDNSTLSMYMGIPNFLSKGQSLMILTYGYSGVGKTFTIFGTKGKQGILQTALLNIRDRKSIYMRTYEIYGMALPYVTYWKNKTPVDYYTKLYTYKFKETLEIEENEIINKDNNIIDYVNNIKIINNENINTNYQILTVDNINNISKFIENIDNQRTEKGRIKKTKNNDQSSRSIMIYEFIVFFNQKKYGKDHVNFVIMDLPGKENINSTYVNINENNLSEFGLKIKDTYTDYYPVALRAALYQNPLFLSVFSKTNDGICSLYNDICLNNNCNYTTINTNSSKLLTVKTLPNDFSGFKINSNPGGFTDQSSQFELVSTNGIKKMLYCNEILKNLIINNKLDVLVNFYENKILDLSENFKNKNYGGISFEGVYINENIVGLINLFINKLISISDQSLKTKYNEYKLNKIDNYFTKLMIQNYNLQEIKYDSDNLQYLNYSYMDIYDNEYIAQTYFFRGFIRDNIFSNNNYYNNDYMRHMDSYNSIIYNGSDSNDYSGNSKEYTSNKKTIKQLVEGGYDYNKIYTDDPPINTILQCYFDNTVINNYNLFYIVSNNKLEKCANQIKLLSDSGYFIDAIHNFVPN